jgi:membrane protein CcdC involved in cytochrome C biogenesis
MIDIDKNTRIISAISNSAYAFIRVFIVTIVFVIVIAFFINELDLKKAINITIEHFDLLAVAFVLGFICDVPYRIYLVCKSKKQTK